MKITKEAAAQCSCFLLNLSAPKPIHRYNDQSTKENQAPNLHSSHILLSRYSLRSPFHSFLLTSILYSLGHSIIK
ncbi:MAG: hypothetical protein K2N35_15360, partial [Muribaculaceae bacterium]|nr:hypothetical protein [Muribaculaceae bacterium]